ncbi:MAG: hypothetical protein ABIC91_02385 [Nanoarchaeota archaeon]|nr:hypothetical protein [Nanoarchaeota archaeon]MBU1030114.1 hypothetical protein [Nanoarchaeota archaeon]MBU1849997.1 hypothetical protein [Nanoarchaeota archaeon]
MEHLAILSKEKKLLEKIICGEKTIESRWYTHKKTPYHKIKPGEVIYFKESGKPVTVKAKVSQTLFFDELNKEKIKSIIQEYGVKICITQEYSSKLECKNYCTLIFLENIQKIEPFNINKRGYGNMAAWITVESINQIKK